MIYNLSHYAIWLRVTVWAPREHSKLPHLTVYGVKVGNFEIKKNCNYIKYTEVVQQKNDGMYNINKRVMIITGKTQREETLTQTCKHAEPTNY